MNRMLLTLLVVSLITGCSNSPDAGKPTPYQEDPAISIVKDELLLYMANDAQSGDLYLQKGSSEREKVASGVAANQFTYLYNTKAVLYFDKDHSLMLKQADNQPILMSKGVIPSSVTISKDESAMLYLKASDPASSADEPGGDLYYQVIGSEKEKIASAIRLGSYVLSDNGKVAAFIDGTSTLYRKEAGVAEKEKIASNVMNCKINGDGSKLVFDTSDGSIYMKDINKPDKEKLTSALVSNLSFSRDNRMLAFLDEYNPTPSKGELMLYINGYDKAKIGSDVTHYQIPDTHDYIYFLNEEQKLFMKEIQDSETTSTKRTSDKSQTSSIKTLNPAEKIKIDDNIVKFAVSPDGRYLAFVDTDDNLFLKRFVEQKTKVGSNVDTMKLYNHTVLYRDKDHSLYTIDLTQEVKEQVTRDDQTDEQPASAVKEKVKLADQVEEFFADESLQYLSYKLQSGEVHQRTSLNQAPTKVIDEGSVYNHIYFLNHTLYERS